MEKDRLISITIKDIETGTELRGEISLSQMEIITIKTDINVLEVMFAKINEELDKLIKK
jgi:hypothetical protein